MQNSPIVKKLIAAIIIVLIGLYQAFFQDGTTNHSTATPSSTASESTQFRAQDKPIQDAIAQKRGDVQVFGEGVVVATLKDDTKGSQHQKFILKLASGDTVLVAHNIDLSPRLNGLQKGDTVAFYGEYETNDKGGVVHWTHKDPGKRHVDGWLKWQGKTYQ